MQQQGLRVLGERATGGLERKGTGGRGGAWNPVGLGVGESSWGSVALGSGGKGGGFRSGGVNSSWGIEPGVVVERVLGHWKSNLNIVLQEKRRLVGNVSGRWQKCSTEI